MKKVCLIGAVDKRLLSYPLIKVMMLLGKTLVVTDDGVYRRFDTQYSTSYSLGNSDFLIVPSFNDEVLEKIKMMEMEYNFVLLVTTNELPPDCDKVIYCRGMERAIITDGSLKALENSEFTEVYITFSKVKDSSLLRIEPSKGIMSYVFNCEDQKEFIPLKDQSVAGVLEKFFQSELDIPKSTIKGLLSREG